MNPSRMGRTGKWCAYQHYAISGYYDAAKPLAGAFRWVRSLYGRGGAVVPPRHAWTTFGGGPLACAVAVAVIDAIEKEDAGQRYGSGDYFQKQLRGWPKA